MPENGFETGAIDAAILSVGRESVVQRTQKSLLHFEFDQLIAMANRCAQAGQDHVAQIIMQHVAGRFPERVISRGSGHNGNSPHR